MGMSGEVVAEKYHVARAEQDRYAAESHRRAAAATREGWFKDEILPISIPQKKGAPVVIDRDEPIRERRRRVIGFLEAGLQRRDRDAGNAPGVNDGAAAVVILSADRARELKLTPLARVVGQATSGLRRSRS